MATDLKAEILAQAARLEELIEKSTNIIEKSNALVAQTHRLIRKTKRQDVDRGNNHKTMPRFPLKPER